MLRRSHRIACDTRNMTCAVDDCDKPSRTLNSSLCGMHYFRLRRSGRLDLAPKPGKLPCLADDCDLPRTGRQLYCHKHRERLRQHGDLEVRSRRGTDDVSYRAAHWRVWQDRGSAKLYHCVDCGGSAQHWSYDHSGRSEQNDQDGHAYSTDATAYLPRCVSCHKKFDLSR